MSNRLQHPPTETIEQVTAAFVPFEDGLHGHGKMVMADLKKFLTTLGDKLTEAEADELLSMAPVVENVVDYELFVSQLMKL